MPKNRKKANREKIDFWNLESVERRLNYWEEFVEENKDNEKFQPVFKAIEKADEDGKEASVKKAEELLNKLDLNKKEKSAFNRKIKILKNRLERRMDPAIGIRIKTLREEKGWTVKYLSEIVNISHSYLGRIEKGTSKTPGFTLLEKIAKGLGVSTPFLLEGEEIYPEKKIQTLTTLFLENKFSLNPDERLLSLKEKEYIIKIIRYISSGNIANFDVEWQNEDGLRKLIEEYLNIRKKIQREIQKKIEIETEKFR
jgi:transcriptional regulator with XRE-family HTH domain